MANISLTGAMTVPGYVKKTVYNGNIEYRNYNPDLVGLQLTSAGGTPLFTMGNFNITTNLDPKTDKMFITKQFSDFITLDGLNLTVDQSQTLLNNNATVFLNIDKSKLSYYATFGSLTEFIRVGLENIIINWPASIYMRPIKVLSNGEQLVGNTYENYSYDNITNKASFRIPTNFINNAYGINFLTNGEISGTFNESNSLRNLITNYESYALLINNTEYNVVGFTGSTSILNDYVYFEIENNPFTATSNTITYHIKPKAIICDNFFNGLDEFEYYLLNRQSYPIYTAIFKYPLRTDFGVMLYTETSVTWPTTDGYNLDYNTSAYDEFANTLLTLANDSDLINSNIMTRFLVSESITGFDTLPYYLSDEDQDTSGGKVNKLLNIYGVSYDDFNRYIEGLSFANTVSYNKLDNTPDVYLKNIARVMGWELIESVVSNDLLTDYIQATQSTFSGQSKGLTPVEADVELWRRLILNTPWLWKSKGTRKSVEFLLRFIGTPNGLITFNEYVYKADKPIDVDLFRTVLTLNGLDDDISVYPIDQDGYPRFFDDTDDMYFQNNGLWYRETSGSNSILDITAGNNPHIGPYDRGYKYFNQLRTLIPDFSAVTITSVTTTNTTQDLFTNYNTGEITDYDGDTYVDIEYTNGLSLPNCYIQTVEIIPDPKPQNVITDCGCPCDVKDESLSICLEKIDVKEEVCFQRVNNNSETGLYVFSVYAEDAQGNQTNDTYETTYIDRKCCTGSPVSGLPMYSDTYNSIDSTIDSGFVCCKIGSKCACNVAKDWIISGSTIQIGGAQYLNFITLAGYGNPVVVGADSSICPEIWTTPIQNVVDPHTGNFGVGCQVLPNALPFLDTLVKAYVDKVKNSLGCGYTFPQIPTPIQGNGNPTDVSVVTPVCRDPYLTSVVTNPDNSLTFNWVLNNTACNSGSVSCQFSLDGVNFSDLVLNTSNPSVNNLSVTTIAGYSFNTLVTFRVKLQYSIGSNCNIPSTKCSVTSNTIQTNFTQNIPQGEGTFILNANTTDTNACVEMNNYWTAIGGSFILPNAIISPSLNIGSYVYKQDNNFQYVLLTNQAGWYASTTFSSISTTFKIDSTGKIIAIGGDCISVIFNL